MRIYQLFHELIAKFVPMDQVTQSDLQLEAVKYYNESIDEIKEVQKENHVREAYNKQHENDLDIEPKSLLGFTMKQRVVKFFESWWMRYLIAIAFIYLVPLIKSYISGEYKGKGEDEEDEDYDESDMFKEYMKFKRSMR